MDGARERGDGLSEEGREHGSRGERETSQEVVYSQTNHSQTGHGLETLVLQMTHSEHELIINSVLRCVRMYCLTDG